MKYINNKNILIFLLFLFSILLISNNVVKNSTIIKNNKKKTNRILFSGIENKKTELICEKADNELFSLYTREYYEEINTNISMKNSTSNLFKYLEGKEGIYLKKYIFSFIFEISVAVFIVLIIIIWILLHCFLSSKNLICLYKNKRHTQFLKITVLGISVSLYFVIILFNVIILFQYYTLIQYINNSFCSLFKITYHTFFGEEKNYEIKPKWIGINEIKNLLQKTKNQIDYILYNKDEIYNLINYDLKTNFYFDLDKGEFLHNYINNFCDFSNNKVTNPNPLCDKNISNFIYCSDILNLIQNEYIFYNFSNFIADIESIYEKLDLIDSNKNDIKFSFDNANNKLDSFIKIISDLEIDYFDVLSYISEEIINEYFIIISYIFFIFILIIEAFSLICIIANIFCSNSNYCYKLYMFIWNIQMFLIIIILLISILFSICSVISKDISIIIKYLINNENIKISKTFSFSKAQYDIEGIDICINGEANLEHYTQLDEGSKSLIHFYSYLNIIKENLNYLINYKIFAEKNETQIIFDELEEKPYLTKYQLNNNNIEDQYLNNITYFSPESILENILNKYTNNENMQNIGNNSNGSNYMFVHSKEFCQSDYDFINFNDSNNHHQYQNGKKCMLINDFPDNDYFKGITVKQFEETSENINYNNSLYDLNNLIKEFKKKYYDNENGFKSTFKQFLFNSKNYYNEIIKPNCMKIKDTLIKIFQIIDDKLNIINQLYENIIGSNNNKLFSIFNCKYLKRDISIFLSQIDLNLSHSLFILSVYCLIIGLFSLICIIINIFIIKLNKMTKNIYELTPKNKTNIDVNDINLSEKPKIEQKDFYDDIIKSNINEKTGFYKKSK